MSYRFPIFETSATTLCGSTVTYLPYEWELPQCVSFNACSSCPGAALALTGKGQRMQVKEVAAGWWCPPKTVTHGNHGCHGAHWLMLCRATLINHGRWGRLREACSLMILRHIHIHMSTVQNPSMILRPQSGAVLPPPVQRTSSISSREAACLLPGDTSEWWMRDPPSSLKNVKAKWNHPICWYTNM